MESMVFQCTMGQAQSKIGIFPPQPPFSPGMIISEKIFGDCPLSPSLKTAHQIF